MPAACERFEIEIGMRQHGALGAAEAVDLDAHLATCATCRAFAASQMGLEQTLHQRTAAEVARIDWQALERGVARLRRSYRLKLWLAPLFFLQVPLVFLIGSGKLPPIEMLVLGPPATVLLYVGFVWLVNRPFRSLLLAGASTEDLAAGYAAELQRRRVRAWVFIVANLGFVALGLAMALLGPADTRSRLSALFVAAFFGVWAFVDLAFTLPRIARNLAEVRR
jgi:hypothetical protein